MQTAPAKTKSESTPERSLALKAALILCAITIVIAVTFALLHFQRPEPLWPGAHYTSRDRDVAVERGLIFIESVASNPKHFSAIGHDILFCFYTISSTAKDEHLREMARRMGQAHARQWRNEHSTPPTGSAEDLYLFVLGENSAEHLLGINDASVKHHAEEVAARFSAVDFFGFDP